MLAKPATAFLPALKALIPKVLAYKPRLEKNEEILD
jgi:hypothetical protein